MTITLLPRPWNTTDGSTINSGLDPRGRAKMECYGNRDWSQRQGCNGTWHIEDPLSEKELKDGHALEYLITVHFSAFGKASPMPFQVVLYPVVSTATSDITPVYLGPGSHLYAVSSVSFKEKSSNQGFAILGIPKVGDRHR